MADRKVVDGELFSGEEINEEKTVLKYETIFTT